jgi:AcrR family transcriptional regulator
MHPSPLSIPAALAEKHGQREQYAICADTRALEPRRYPSINLYIGNMRSAMASPSVHVRRARLPRAERERQMLQAAHLLFAERGYSGVTMDDVAGAIGVTKPLLYNYFGNKERLYLACMQPAAEALMKTVLDAVTPTRTPADALDAGLRAFFAFLAADRDAWRVLFDETLPASGEVARRVVQYREQITELVARALLAQLPGSPSPRAQRDVSALSTAVLGAAEALGRWWLRTDAIAPDAAAELLISTLGPGLRERARGKRSRAAA